MGMLERDGRVKARVIDNVTGPMLHVIRENVEQGAELITDAARGYRALGQDFLHRFVDHMHTYVEGHVHTNGIENFWSLLKRAIRGTYVNVEPFHLHRYVEEQAFRYNERKGKDADRFVKALRSVVGRRLTYAALTQAPA
jgi:hypothetical protein